VQKRGRAKELDSPLVFGEVREQVVLGSEETLADVELGDWKLPLVGVPVLDE
jgi:hypothetical protein